MKKFIIALLVLIPLSLNAQWEVLNEGFKGSINTIDFVNENVGWIAGSNGTLVKTIDGGENWITIPIDENWNIDAIDFINESVGWAIGGAYIDPNWNNYIWNTSNGGNTWVQQFTSIVFGFNSLYVIDATNVFVVGGNKIYKTMNGGTNWINVSPNLLDRNYNTLYLQDSETGVVVGNYNDGIRDKGLILKTTNGGGTWNQTIVNEFTNIYDLQFLDNTSGYFGAHLDTTHFIYKTEDMCETWNIITQVPAQNPWTNPIKSYQFLDTMLAYAIMDDSISSNNVMKSTDGGLSWNKIYTPVSGFPFNNIYFSKLSTAFLLCSGFPSYWGISMYSAFFMSVDCGLSWELREFNFPITDISFINNNQGFIVGGLPVGFHFCGWGILMSTANEGNSWDVKYYVSTPLSACKLLSDSLGLIMMNGSQCSFGGIHKTNDFGNSWNEVVYPGYYLIGGELCFNVDKSSGWAVCWDPGNNYYTQILLTTDYGENWDIVWRDSSYNEPGPFSICYADTAVWCVNNLSHLIKYTPQTGWVRQTSVTDLPLNKVFFSDDNHGWIAGGYQNENDFQTILLKTTNGGIDWNTVPNVSYLIKDIAFIDNNLGWAIGYTQTGTGGILKTTDGGTNWTVDTGNLSSKLNSLFIKDNYGWAVGDNGLILRTTDAGAVWVEDENNNTSPTGYFLEQNYPNPFNPSTTIKYKIPLGFAASPFSKGGIKGGFVTLKVYDVLGREVATLVNEEQPAGVYEVEFDSKTLSSGIYFYALRAGSYTANKENAPNEVAPKY